MTEWCDEPIGMDADGNAITRCPRDIGNENARSGIEHRFDSPDNRRMQHLVWRLATSDIPSHLLDGVDQLRCTAEKIAADNTIALAEWLVAEGHDIKQLRSLTPYRTRPPRLP